MWVRLTVVVLLALLPLGARESLRSEQKRLALERTADPTERVAYRFGRETAHHTPVPRVEVSAPPRPSVGEPFVTYFAGAKDVTATRIASDAAGHVYIAGGVRWVTGFEGPGRFVTDLDVFLTKLDPTGEPIYTLYYGGDGKDEVQSMAVDASGAIVLAGRTNSANFPIVDALQPELRGATDAFVCRLDPTGGFDFCTYLGGADDDVASAVATDVAGAVYVTGYTESVDFPVTPGAFQTTTQPPDNFRRPSDAFVTKVAPDGQALVFSTYLGGREVDCFGGSRCIPAASREWGRAIAVDVLGNAYVGGTTNSRDFPTTPDAVQQACACDFFSTDLFIAELDSSGAGLVFSTYLGGRAPSDRAPEESIADLAIDAEGNVFVAGATGSLATETGGPPFPTTPGAVQPTFTFADSGGAIPVSFVSKLAAGGAALAYSTFLTGKGSGSVSGLALEPDGTLHVVGSTAAADFPVTEAAFPRGGDFYSRLSTDGSRLLFSTLLPGGFGGMDVSLGPAWRACLTGASGYASCLGDSGVTLPPLLGFANAAAGPVTGRFAPLELISLFGPDVGPPDATGLQLGPDGRVTTRLGGVEVLVDGTPLPLLFAQRDQIDAVSPAALLSLSPHIEVRKDGAVVGRLRAARIAADPEVFRVPSGQQVLFAAALNQDGGVNLPETPAALGSVVAIFATGLGRTWPIPQDGALPTDDLPQVLTEVQVIGVDGTSLEVFYAGQAPGLVAGVMQVNFRLAAPFPIGMPGDLVFRLVANGVASGEFAIAVRP